VEEVIQLAIRGARVLVRLTAACPNWTTATKMMELLEPGRIGVRAGPELLVAPRASQGRVRAAPSEAKYFNV